MNVFIFGILNDPDIRKILNINGSACPHVLTGYSLYEDAETGEVYLSDHEFSFIRGFVINVEDKDLSSIDFFLDNYYRTINNNTIIYYRDYHNNDYPVQNLEHMGTIDMALYINKAKTAVKQNDYYNN